MRRPVVVPACASSSPCSSPRPPSRSRRPPPRRPAPSSARRSRRSVRTSSSRAPSSRRSAGTARLAVERRIKGDAAGRARDHRRRRAGRVEQRRHPPARRRALADPRPGRRARDRVDLDLRGLGATRRPTARHDPGLAAATGGPAEPAAGGGHRRAARLARRAARDARPASTTRDRHHDAGPRRPARAPCALGRERSVALEPGRNWKMRSPRSRSEPRMYVCAAHLVDLDAPVVRAALLDERADLLGGRTSLYSSTRMPSA